MKFFSSSFTFKFDVPSFNPFIHWNSIRSESDVTSGLSSYNASIGTSLQNNNSKTPNNETISENHVASESRRVDALTMKYGQLPVQKPSNFPMVTSRKRTVPIAAKYSRERTEDMTTEQTTILPGSESQDICPSTDAIHKDLDSIVHEEPHKKRKFYDLTNDDLKFDPPPHPPLKRRKKVSDSSSETQPPPLSLPLWRPSIKTILQPQPRIIYTKVRTRTPSSPSLACSPTTKISIHHRPSSIRLRTATQIKHPARRCASDSYNPIARKTTAKSSKRVHFRSPLRCKSHASPLQKRRREGRVKARYYFESAEVTYSLIRFGVDWRRDKGVLKRGDLARFDLADGRVIYADKWLCGERVELLQQHVAYWDSVGEKNLRESLEL